MDTLGFDPREKGSIPLSVALFCSIAENKFKDVKIIKPITRDEADWLRNNKMSNYVKHSYSRYKTYYCVEEPHVLRELNKYRKEKTK